MHFRDSSGGVIAYCGVKGRKMRKLISISQRLRAISLCSLLGLAAGALQAQTPPYALLQNATIVGAGNTITASQVPVVTAAGVTVYVNLTLQLSPDATGNFTVAAGSPQTTLAPVLISSSFRAGTYAAGPTTLSGTGLITVAGPGVADGGGTVWNVNAASGANGSTYPVNASWYSGAIANSPYAARLKAVGLTSTIYSYGVIGAQNCCSNWSNNDLIGVSQIGNTLTFYNFTVGGKDQALPWTQIVYTLKQ
jgi:hypothetical protein